MQHVRAPFRIRTGQELVEAARVCAATLSSATRANAEGKYSIGIGRV
jgi:hypothetical protein